MIGKNIFVRPARKIRAYNGRKRFEKALRDMRAALVRQKFIEFFLDCVQVNHIVAGIVELCMRQFRRAPVGALLFFGNLHAQQMLGHVFQIMRLRIGAGDARGDLEAIDIFKNNIEVMADPPQVQIEEPGRTARPIARNCSERG